MDRFAPTGVDREIARLRREDLQSHVDYWDKIFDTILTPPPTAPQLKTPDDIRQED